MMTVEELVSRVKTHKERMKESFRAHVDNFSWHIRIKELEVVLFATRVRQSVTIVSSWITMLQNVVNQDGNERRNKK